MSSSICGLKITQTDGSFQFINCQHVYYYNVSAPTQSSPFILGKLTGVKYGISHSGTGDVTIASIPAYNGTNPRYEWGWMANDGIFATMASN